MHKKSSKKAWLVFVGCCVMSLVGFGLVVNTPGLYFTSITGELGITQAQIAMTLTISAIMQALTLIFAGKIMEKVDSRVLLSGCTIVFGGGFIAVSLFHSIVPFYVVYALIGVAQAIALSLAIPVLLSNWFEEKLGMVMGVALGLSGIGGAIFNQIVSRMIMAFGWRTSYMVAGIILFVCILPFSALVFKYGPDREKGEYPYGYSEQKKQEDEKSAEGISAKEAYKTPSFLLYVVAIILLQMVAGMVQQVSTHVQNMGFDLATGASVVSGIMLGAAVGKATIGALLDKINGKVVAIVFAVLGMFGWGGLLLAGVSFLLIMCGFILGLGQGLLLVGIPWYVRNTFGNKNYSQIFSIISMFGAFASAAASSINGLIFDLTGKYTVSLTMNVIFYACAAFCVVTAFSLRKKLQDKGGKQK